MFVATFPETLEAVVIKLWLVLVGKQIMSLFIFYDLMINLALSLVCFRIGFLRKLGLFSTLDGGEKKKK